MYSYCDELYHEGVKGMHWYVRRYQNPDGTLTALGRVHYGVKDFYNGPKMEHLKSQMARGWATANDPAFLGRRIADVKASLGRANIIVNDPKFWKQDIGSVRDFVRNYFNDKKTANVDPRAIDVHQIGSFNVDYGQLKGNQWKSNDVYSLESGIHKSGEAALSGNTLLSLYEARENGKNVKMSDLASFTVSDTMTEEYKKEHDLAQVKYKTRTFESQGPYSMQLSSALDPSGHMIFDTGKQKVQYDIPVAVDVRAIYDKYNKDKAKYDNVKMFVGDPINADVMMADAFAYANKRKEKSEQRAPEYEKQISNIYRDFYSS